MVCAVAVLGAGKGGDGDLDVGDGEIKLEGGVGVVSVVPLLERASRARTACSFARRAQAFMGSRCPVSRGRWATLRGVMSTAMASGKRVGGSSGVRARAGSAEMAGEEWRP